VVEPSPTKKKLAGLSAYKAHRKSGAETPSTEKANPLGLVRLGSTTVTGPGLPLKTPPAPEVRMTDAVKVESPVEDRPQPTPPLDRAVDPRFASSSS
jgi:hypothetical protein